MDLRIGRTLDRHQIAELLFEARTRTLLLVAPLSEKDLRMQHSSLMSPIVWDLGHIARFEELWLLKNVDAPAGGEEALQGIYDPFDHPRSTRDELPLPSGSEAMEYMARVRSEVLERLEHLDLGACTPLLQDGYVFRMVLQHEYQHNETILQTLQLKKGEPYPAPRAREVPDPAEGGAPPADSMVRFPGGEVTVGTDDRSASYDNERSRHERTLEPFWIDANPVTEGQYLEFMNDGGYRRPALWSGPGREWLAEREVESPRYWEETGEGWTVRIMDRRRPVDPRRPLCHVCFYEADAYARWAGKRLPTEFEWEAAASWNPETRTPRLYPWGTTPPSPATANVDQLLFDTAPLGSHPRNVSPIGCYGMIGDVWEWTSSHFRGYPGYEAFPYEEYSEAFFGSEYRVLRGGSWATRSGAIRNTFRNWDFPVRRQIFAGFRCARDD